MLPRCQEAQTWDALDCLAFPPSLSRFFCLSTVSRYLWAFKINVIIDWPTVATVAEFNLVRPSCRCRPDLSRDIGGWGLAPLGLLLLLLELNHLLPSQSQTYYWDAFLHPHFPCLQQQDFSKNGPTDWEYRTFEVKSIHLEYFPSYSSIMISPNMVYMGCQSDGDGAWVRYSARYNVHCGHVALSGGGSKSVPDMGPKFG